MKVGLVEYQGRVFYLCELKHQLVGLIKKFNGISFPTCFRQGDMDIPIFAGEHIGGGAIDLFWKEWLDEQAIAIDENEGIFCLPEQRVPVGADLSAGDLTDQAISFADIYD